MKAELKRLHSPDAYDLVEYAPEDPSHFGLLVQAMVGPDGDDSEESFDIVVCSSSWICEKFRDEPVASLRHHLLMNQYSFESLHAYIDLFCRNCEGPNWEALASRLSRLGRWEFEDYRE